MCKVTADMPVYFILILFPFFILNTNSSIIFQYIIIHTTYVVLSYAEQFLTLRLCIEDFEHTSDFTHGLYYCGQSS